MQNQRHKRILTVLFIGFACCGSVTGCSQSASSGLNAVQTINNDSTLDGEEKSKKIFALYQKITNDPSLNATQRQHALEVAGFTGGVQSGQDGSGTAVIIGVLAAMLLVGALIARQRQQAAYEASWSANAYGSKGSSSRSSGKPTSKGSKSNGGSAPTPVRSSAPPLPPMGQMGLDPMAGYAAEKPTVKIPSNQREVDALPFDERGASFFTSRPYPSAMLTRAYITVGGKEHRIVCTTEEAEQINTGARPMVRAFTIDGRTEPWYYWEMYNPFGNYWAAMNEEWLPGGKRAIVCFVPLDEVDPQLPGYYSKGDKKEAAEVPAPSDEKPTGAAADMDADWLRLIEIAQSEDGGAPPVPGPVSTRSPLATPSFKSNGSHATSEVFEHEEAAKMAEEARKLEAEQLAKASELAKAAQAAKADRIAKLAKAMEEAEAAEQAQLAEAARLAKEAQKAKELQLAKAKLLAEEAKAAQARAAELARAMEIVRAHEAEQARQAELAKLAEITDAEAAAKAEEQAASKLEDVSRRVRQLAQSSNLNYATSSAPPVNPRQLRPHVESTPKVESPSSVGSAVGVVDEPVEAVDPLVEFLNSAAQSGELDAEAIRRIRRQIQIEAEEAAARRRAEV